MVHRQVVGDAEEPGGERCRLPAEALDRLEHLQERLSRQVLGVGPVADAHVQVAVDPIEMEEVELLERFAVSLLSPLDESPQVVGRVHGRRRGSTSGFLGHQAGEFPVGTASNSLGRGGAEADPALPREPLHIDDALQGDRVAAVLGIQRERRLTRPGSEIGRAERLLEGVGARR